VHDAAVAVSDYFKLPISIPSFMFVSIEQFIELIYENAMIFVNTRLRDIFAFVRYIDG
jgi:hypothetical protein